MNTAWQSKIGPTDDLGSVLDRSGVEILNPDGSSPIILACDHAGNVVPPHLNNLGLSQEALQGHVGWDIGAADVTRHLSQLLDAPAIFQHVSRLVIDVNRSLEHPASIPPKSDVIEVPGNKDLSGKERMERQLYFWDYHVNLEALIARVKANGQDPIILFVHSFTGTLEIKSEVRPWHLGVLHGNDRILSDILYEELCSAHPELLIGDDVPYSGANSGAYSHIVHGEDANIPFSLLEIRQDLIQTKQGAADWAERLRAPFMRSIVRLEPKLSTKGGKRPNLNFGARVDARALGETQRFTMGMEEEYFIVHKETGIAEPNPPREVFESLKDVPRGMVTPEFFRFQIEIGTEPNDTIKGLREEVVALRSHISETLDQHNLALVASGTHPTAHPDEHRHTDAERYKGLWRDQAYPVRRLLTCGMHIHAGIPDLGLRNDLFGQIRYFLPFFLAPSTSSPFWCGKKTDFMCYRLPVFHELKNTGLPPVFADFESYVEYVENAVRMNIITDPTMFWWDVRPNWNNPTLESRISDVCTSVDDAMAIAALYMCTLSMLARLREAGKSWRVLDEALIRSNLWDAGKHGSACTMVDIAHHQRRAFREIYLDLVDQIEPEIKAYDCADEIAHILKIVDEGTSAHHQIRIYEETAAPNDDKEAALRDVLQWLMRRTVEF